MVFLLQKAISLSVTIFVDLRAQVAFISFILMDRTSLCNSEDHCFSNLLNFEMLRILVFHHHWFPWLTSVLPQLTSEILQQHALDNVMSILLLRLFPFSWCEYLSVCKNVYCFLTNKKQKKILTKTEERRVNLSLTFLSSVAPGRNSSQCNLSKP